MALLHTLLVALSLCSVVLSQSDISLDFVAAAPFSYDPEIGGGAFNLRKVGTDVTENLNGNEFSCGDRVTFLTSITVSRAASAPNQNLKMCFDFNADTSGQSGVAFTKVLATKINYGLVSNGANNATGAGGLGYDSGIVDDGASQVLEAYSWRVGAPFSKGAILKACVLISDLEPSEKVVLRQDLLVECKPYSTPSGGLAASLMTATRAVPGTTVNASVGSGAQTINLKLPQGSLTPLARTAMSLLGPSDVCNEDTDFSPVSASAFAGDTLRYCIKVRNPGTQDLLDVKVAYDSGTPLNVNDDVFPPLGPAFGNLGGNAAIQDLASGGVGFIVMEVTAIVLPAVAKFSVTTTGTDTRAAIYQYTDSMSITFSELPHLVFVRHEVSQNLLSLIPELRTMSRCETFILPYWRTSWGGGNTNTLLVGSSPDTITGLSEKQFFVSTTDRTYTFVVRYYSKRVFYADTGVNRKTSYYLIDYSHPFDSPADQNLYDTAWRLSIVPMCNLEAELTKIQALFFVEEIQAIRKMIPVFQLCFDAVSAQLLDTVIIETTLVDHLAKTSAISLFANSVYSNLASVRRWQLILALEDYVYFREALSPATLTLFGITGDFAPFTASSGYFLLEAYAVHYSYFVTVPANYIKNLIITDSSTHMPFPFYGILRRELYMAADQQRLRVLFPGVDSLRWSIPARDYGTQSITSITTWKATARTTFTTNFPNKYCSGNPTHWAVWMTNQVDSFDGSFDIVKYANILKNNGVCLIFVSGIPCSSTFEALLGDLDATHTIAWISEYDSDNARLALLASDFGFLPNVEAGWPLVAIEMLMHGLRIISPANGGIRDVAIFRDPASVPTLATFNTALSVLPSASTSTLSAWLAAPSLCSQIFPYLLPHTYSFTLTRGLNFYSEPLESSLVAALTLAKADQALFQPNEAQYLRSLLLQGHCYQWRSNSLYALREYRNMLAQLSAATGGPTATAAAASALVVPASFIPFSVNQRAQFVGGSEHLVQCPEGSLSTTIPGSAHSNTFRSEYVAGGVIGVLGITGVAPSVSARYLVANIVDKKYFPDVICTSLGSEGSFSDSTVFVAVDSNYSPLPTAVGLLSLNQKLSIHAHVTTALTSLSTNNMCHGALTAESVMISVISATEVDIKLIGLSTPTVGDVTEVECIAADTAAWTAIKSQYSL